MQPVKCTVRGVFMAVSDTATVPAVVLADGGRRQLTIFVGLWEAISINSAQNKEVPPRPLTHDLFLDLMAKYAITVSSLNIDSVDDGVFYAHLELSSGHDVDYLDCRPSDGIAVALRANAPIFVDEELLTGDGKEGYISDMVDFSAFLRE